MSWRHSQGDRAAFIGEPVAYFIALAIAVVFVLTLALVASFVVIPIAILALGGYVLFRRYQTNRIRSAIYAPPRALQPISSAQSPSPEAPQSNTFQAPDELATFIDGALLRNFERETGLFSPQSLSATFTTVFRELYAEESFHAPPPPPASTDRITVARYLDAVDRWRAKTSDPDNLEVFGEAVGQAYLKLRDAFPSFILQRSPDTAASIFTAPLQISPAAAAARAEFMSEDVKQRHLFEPLRKQLEKNLTGIKDEKLKDPGFDDYFADTPFLAFRDCTIPLRLPDETRFAGHWIVAPPGRGKTTLLHALVNDDLPRDASIILIDSKGDLIEPIKQLQSVKDRLVLIEPDPDAALALNPLDVAHANVHQAVTLIEYVLAGLLDAKFTALQSTLFRNVVPAIIETIPNPTLDTFKQVMVKGLPSLDKLSPHARQFFENRETGFNSKTYEGTRKEVVWRLDYLLSNPVMQSMFSATHTRLDLGREMDAGKVIIINNSKAILGDEGAEFFGRFFVALIARAAQQRVGRPQPDKKPCYVYIDECQSVIAKDVRIPVLLDECRSQNIALILAHQRTAQLTAPVLDAVANCAIRMANSDDEAKYLADKLRMDPATLRGLPRGTFGTFIRDLTPTGTPLSVVKLEFGDLPKMTADDMRGVRERMRADFSTPSGATPAAAAPTAPPQGPDPATTNSPEPEPQQTEQTKKTDPGEPSDQW